MKKILLNPNPTRDINLECTKKVAAFFKENGVAVSISEEVEGAESAGAKVEPFDEAVKDADLVISFGGDGTLLDTASRVSSLGIPVLGINIGRIGYMAEIESHEIEYLQHILDGDYKVEERMMLDISVRRGNEVVFEDVALNDAVIFKSGVSWTIDMDIYADNMFISRYSGDGVIVATPTGSTAYSLSAGGPIIDPLARNITITPVCTHALTAKPIVLFYKRVINIIPHNKKDKASAVSADGGKEFELLNGDVLTIKMSDTKTKLIHVKNNNFYDVLYTKLSDRRFD
ncbi:MAG: NAD(+)/NADH kinase [Oscillospiraceae bacterium]|nr:NAD(+)/NADH kinase [Oscillospiraceae bacterium]MBQ6847232.1 NAD(+)/NADH kinase [Oscillospiraceae bacterium]MBQ7120591.1 NAD(+)/NADH kinase [Oscillospiraceae bacterium]